jgi:hypothetical protein
MLREFCASAVVGVDDEFIIFSAGGLRFCRSCVRVGCCRRRWASSRANPLLPSVPPSRFNVEASGTTVNPANR